MIGWRIAGRDCGTGTSSTGEEQGSLPLSPHRGLRGRDDLDFTERTLTPGSVHIRHSQYLQPLGHHGRYDRTAAKPR